MGFVKVINIDSELVINMVTISINFKQAININFKQAISINFKY